MPYKKIVIGNLLYGNLLYLLFCLICFLSGVCIENEACCNYLPFDFFPLIFFAGLHILYRDAMPHLLFSINFTAAIFLIFMFFFINKEPRRNRKIIAFIAFIASFAVAWLCGGILSIIGANDQNYFGNFFYGILATIIFIVPTLLAIPMALYNKKVFPKYADYLLLRK